MKKLNMISNVCFFQLRFLYATTYLIKLILNKVFTKEIVLFRLFKNL